MKQDAGNAFMKTKNKGRFLFVEGLWKKRITQEAAITPLPKVGIFHGSLPRMTGFME
jgi:hypothetical protein